MQATACLDKQIDDHTHTHFDGKAQVAEQIKGIGSITTATLRTDFKVPRDSQ